MSSSTSWSIRDASAIAASIALILSSRAVVDGSGVDVVTFVVFIRSAACLIRPALVADCLTLFVDVDVLADSFVLVLDVFADNLVPAFDVLADCFTLAGFEDLADCFTLPFFLVEDILPSSDVHPSTVVVSATAAVIPSLKAIFATPVEV